MSQDSLGSKSLEEYGVVKSVDYLNNAMVIDLGEVKEVRLVADFDNIERLQRLMGRGEMRIVSDFHLGNFGVVDVAKIIFSGLDRRDKRFTSYSEVGDVILKSKKLEEYIAVAMGYVTLSMTDGKDAAAKKAPAGG